MFPSKTVLKIKVPRFCRRRPEDDIFRSKAVVFENNNKNAVLDGIISICWNDNYTKRDGFH
jgi:hypothetical protein